MICGLNAETLKQHQEHDVAHLRLPSPLVPLAEWQSSGLGAFGRRRDETEEIAPKAANASTGGEALTEGKSGKINKNEKKDKGRGRKGAHSGLQTFAAKRSTSKRSERNDLNMLHRPGLGGCRKGNKGGRGEVPQGCKSWGQGTAWVCQTSM